MDKLVFGMRVLNITQSGTMIDGKPNLSHKNMALDLAGCDSGKDFWFATSRMKCIGEMWLHNLKGERFRGYGTYAFTFVDEQGNPVAMRMADGSEKIVTLAMTHSTQEYIKSIPGKIYDVGKPVYEEGGKGAKGDFTYANHIHLEIAEGITINKYQDKNLGTFRMKTEINPVNCFFILDEFTKVKSTHGLTFKHTDSVHVQENEMIYFKPVKDNVRLRSAPVSGSVLTYIYKGNRAEVIGFTNRIESDGYEWAKVKYGKFTGYVQLDLKMYVLEK